MTVFNRTLTGQVSLSAQLAVPSWRTVPLISRATLAATLTANSVYAQTLIASVTATPTLRTWHLNPSPLDLNPFVQRIAEMVATA